MSVHTLKKSPPQTGIHEFRMKFIGYPLSNNNLSCVCVCGHISTVCIMFGGLVYCIMQETSVGTCAVLAPLLVTVTPWLVVGRYDC